MLSNQIGAIQIGTGNTIIGVLFFFNLQIFFIHNDKPKNTNRAVIHTQALYHNTTISLV